LGKEILEGIELNRIYQMDCLEGMKLIPDKSIDMILCDLPYGTTACKWDTIIPFEPLWIQYERIIKDNGSIVLFGGQPFTSALVMSNPKIFKYSWVWKKSHSANFAVAKYVPLKRHEDILVFYKNKPTYNPQMTIGEYQNKRIGEVIGEREKDTYLTNKPKILKNVKNNLYYPTTILDFNCGARKDSIHPTQKPVALFEYLIKTYTNERDIVLDNCMGSGTTAIAATISNRKWIGFETESKYVQLANKRLEQIQLEDDLKDYE